MLRWNLFGVPLRLTDLLSPLQFGTIVGLLNSLIFSFLFIYHTMIKHLLCSVFVLFALEKPAHAVVKTEIQPVEILKELFNFIHPFFVQLDGLLC
ncbi:hypothetical protein CW304_16830 [Bacillus sp. UFRGS-B20]|nr:hypothetical protein CW304_16830 [Bacillus sp. UFRGS-B20]